MLYTEEQEYEEISEYLGCVQKNLAPTAVKMLARPFSFVGRCDDGNIQIGVKTEGNYLKTFVKTYTGRV